MGIERSKLYNEPLEAARRDVVPAAAKIRPERLGAAIQAHRTGIKASCLWGRTAEQAGNASIHACSPQSSGADVVGSRFSALRKSPGHSGRCRRSVEAEASRPGIAKHGGRRKGRPQNTVARDRILHLAGRGERGSRPGQNPQVPRSVGEEQCPDSGATNRCAASYQGRSCSFAERKECGHSSAG